ncbi:hypothetical protein SAMN06297144_2391 [Sphingomonas guangdongensis]|uniref:Lipoprotein n=1 Tax=Sphingomonas guangdongensis TaxID=1141890 RepID=A0A285R093_9SPHN|nr:hypothetical protein [Sphingomonas guangdongensis]SOB87264.1 hypothetical protein SAMN06297144_2391 [Sphingomonas guangdongensis]
MIARLIAPMALLTLASCPVARHTSLPAVPSLEQAAIARGLVRDPTDIDLSGLYARDTDRLCITGTALRYRIGAFVDYGDGIACNAAGSVTRDGQQLRVDFGEDCRFDARFDGERVTFPGRVPPGCARRCARRASLAALEVQRLSGSAAEAAAMRNGRGEQPCG